MKYTSNCINCGEPIITDKCGVCGYEFSLPWECPKLINNGSVCILTRKLCRNKNNFEQCTILRGHN